MTTSLLRPNIGGGATMALDLPPITALRQAPVPAKRDDFQPSGIVTNFNQDDVVDGWLCVFFFTGGFANDSSLGVVPEMARSYVQHNLPPYSEQQNFREQLVSNMRVMDEQDGKSEFRDFTMPFARRTLARAQTVGDFDDPGWEINDMIVALIDDADTLKRVRRHGYFPGVDNALVALKGFSSQYALPLFATVILAVQQTDRPQYEIDTISAAHTMLNKSNQNANVWSGQKLRRQQTLFNIADRRSPPENEPAPGVPTLPTITFEPQQPAPGVPTLPTITFEPQQPAPGVPAAVLEPQPAPGVPVEQVQQIVEQKVGEIKQVAQIEHDKQVEELKQAANIEHAQIIQQKEARHQQEVEALKQIAQANHKEMLRAWQEEARAEMMRVQAELDRTAQRLREKYAQVPPMPSQYEKPAPAVIQTPTMPTLLDVRQKSGNTMDIDVGPPQPVVFVEPAPAQVEAPPLQAQTSLVKPSVAAVSTVQPTVVSQASVAKVVEAKTAVASTVEPVNAPTIKYDTAPPVKVAAPTPIVSPPTQTAAPILKPSPVLTTVAPPVTRAPFAYVKLPPEVQELVATTRARAKTPKTELEKAKAIADKWWKAHPRAEAQDKALKNQKVVTKAADYVPSKTDFRGVDLLRNSKSRAKK